MKYLEIEFHIKNQPLLDPAFVPFGVWVKAYLEGTDRPFSIAVEREKGKISVFRTKLRGADFAEANYRYVMLPDEKFRRVGQSMAADSLPEF